MSTDDFPLSTEALARRTGELLFGAVRSYDRFWTAARRQADELIADVATIARKTQIKALLTSPEGKAVEAVARAGEAPDIVSALVRQSRPELRRHLLSELLVRGTEESVGAYLMFVALPQSRREALAALQHADRPPHAALLTFLRSPRAELRNAAALARSELDRS